MFILEHVCEENLQYYKKYEDDFESELKNYLSRIYPSKKLECHKWYHIKVESEYIGAIWLEKSVKENFAVLGIFISDKDYRNRGIGKAAIRQIIKQDLSFMKTNKVVLHVREENARAIACYKSVGFKEAKRYTKDNVKAIEMQFLFNPLPPSDEGGGFCEAKDGGREMDFISKEPINKGWSGDKKYCVTDTDGTKYLLRITPFEKSANREKMYFMQQQVEKLGVPMCRPVDFGECEEGIYILQTWIDGKDAEEVIPHLTDFEQYAFGIEAGEILKKIHSIPAPDDQPDWEDRFNKKMDKKIGMYNDCPIKFDGAEFIIDYIEANRHLLRGRPQCYQHGDYHIGNMMIENGRVVIIDFDRYDFGDPWEEFNRIVWCAQKAPSFASGIVDGYFGNDVPYEFWQLLAMYIASNTLSSVAWSITFGEKEIRTMLDQASDVLEWYNNMKTCIPTWYTGVR